MRIHLPPLALTVTAASLLLGACTFDRGTLPPEPAATLTFRLSGQNDGTLAYCDDDGCRTVPNPGGCAVLEVNVSMGTGDICERCLDANGTELSRNCDETSIVCTIITAPEPDCAVCAHVGGSVIYSSCVPTDPLECVYLDAEGTPVDPSTGGGAGCLTDSNCSAGEVCVTTGAENPAGLCLPDCKICYDSSGRPVLSECQAACSSVVCPQIDCAEGFVAMVSPGECCAQCVQDSSCEAIVCAQDTAIPSCPDGTELSRDPTDCCHYVCQPVSCSNSGTSAPSAGCPTGYHWETDYPACGRCEIDDDAQACSLSDDCGADEVCTTELGDCQAGPSCANGSVCETCWGVCRPEEYECNTTGVTLISYCEGEWVSPGLDTFGCPLPPVCTCPDGVLSTTGYCADQCGNVACFAPPPECNNDEILVTDYPYCCGACIPVIDNCTSPGGGIGQPDPIVCPAIACGEGYHTEQGADCCATCVRDAQPTCLEPNDCLTDELCSFGDCQPGSAGCTGVCVPAESCVDSDGVDPSVRGYVDVVSWGQHTEKADKCETQTILVEYWCYAPYPGSRSLVHGALVFDCEHGCVEGACRVP